MNTVFKHSVDKWVVLATKPDEGGGHKQVLISSTQTFCRGTVLRIASLLSRKTVPRQMIALGENKLCLK